MTREARRADSSIRTSPHRSCARLLPLLLPLALGAACSGGGDETLLTQDIPGMGPETIGDASWEMLFDSGPLAENPDITIDIVRPRSFNVQLEEVDQLGTPRPAGTLGDVGAIEIP